MPLCFDLDGTLGFFGSGYALLRKALGELWGAEPSAVELKACAGSTDWEIVDELHRHRFHAPLEVDAYEAYDRVCLAHFEAAYGPGGQEPVVHAGLVAGMARLRGAGLPVWLVSGNPPRVLAFKARALGVDPRIPLLGSLPHHDRAGLIRRAVHQDEPPHLYVGDRPHDRDAAAEAGIPFLGVGDAVPGEHPLLDPEAEAGHLVEAVEGLLSRRGAPA